MLSKIANSPRLLVITALGILVVSSTAYQFAERKGPIDSLYWAVITATTVGYGDMYPTTPAGRVVATGLVISMVLFFIPMVTAGFASKLIVDRNAFTHEEQEELKDSVKRLVELIEEKS